MSRAPDNLLSMRKRGLRLLGGLTALAVVLAACLWGRGQLVWVNQRREVLALDQVDPSNIVVAFSMERIDSSGYGVDQATAPWVPRLLGEPGVAQILDRRPCTGAEKAGGVRSP